jgi:stress response protein SCP2
VTQDINGDVRKWLANNLYAKSSIKEALKEDIEFSINHFGLEFLDAKRVVFKEIKSYVMKYLWNKGDYSTLSKFVGTPTDILRMFAAITDGDISLSEKIRFPKLSRPQRRFVLDNLEGRSNLADNLNTYKGLWLALGRYIHPGEYQSKYPKAFKAFDTLRNSKVSTFGGTLEEAIKNRDLDRVLKLVSNRPGVFGRKLHEIVDVFADRTGVIKEFKKVATGLELKNLLVLEKYFATINDLEYRTVINKKGRIIVFPNERRGKLTQKRVEKILTGIKEAIATKVAEAPLEFEEGTKVWIDPELRNYMVPLSLRKQDDSLMNYARGTRIKFDKDKILRLFAYWKQSSQITDYDLSLIGFDKNMNQKWQVSYTNLRHGTNAVTHSGDITSAPNGASEFVDVRFDKLSSDIKYISIQVLNFSGENFMDVDKSYAGWMLRDKAKAARKTFDIKTVANKFNMAGVGKYAIPMVVDIDKSEIVVIDLFMKGLNQCNRVEGAVQNISTVIKELVKMYDTKPNMLDLVKYRIEASNVEIVESKEDATVTYGITGVTHSVDRVDEILAELL